MVVTTIMIMILIMAIVIITIVRIRRRTTITLAITIQEALIQINNTVWQLMRTDSKQTSF